LLRGANAGNFAGARRNPQDPPRPARSNESYLPDITRSPIGCHRRSGKRRGASWSRRRC
jgi:hypothetical protein